MAAPAIGRRRAYTPGVNAQVDWQHPASAGLWRYVTAADGIEHVTGAGPIARVGGGLTPSMFGPARTGSTTTYLQYQSPPPIIAAEISLIVVSVDPAGQVAAFGGMASIDRNSAGCLSIQNQTGGAANGFGGFYRLNGGGDTSCADQLDHLFGNTALHCHRWRTGTAFQRVTINTRTMAWTSASGASPSGVIDYSTPTYFNVGNTRDPGAGSLGYTGHIVMCAWYQSRVTDDQLNALAGDPFCVLRY